MKPQQCIILKGVNKGFGDRPILKDVSVSINQSDYTVIMGPSGSGKSTLLNIIGVLDAPDSGQVMAFGLNNPWGNKRIARELRKSYISYLFQNFALVENLTVRQNLDLINENLGLKFLSLKKNTDILSDSLFNKDGREGTGRFKEKLEHLLEDMQINHLIDKKVYELSGGEQQRVALIRAMIKPHKILLADEPTGSLDEKNKRYVMGCLAEIHRKGCPVVVVTHDLDFVSQATRVFKLIDGRLHEVNVSR